MAAPGNRLRLEVGLVAKLGVRVSGTQIWISLSPRARMRSRYLCTLRRPFAASHGACVFSAPVLPVFALSVFFEAVMPRPAFGYM